MRVIKSRIMRWARYVALHTEFGGEGGNLREKNHLEVLGAYVMIILKWIFRKLDGRMDWIDLV
jgi:hypothetical protein